MAEGRMLSKRVTKSDKVAGLSSDTARMLYCFIIPYLDVEGRMEVNPKLMKGEIAPLLDHVTPEVINNVLQELHNIELITLYSDQSGKKTYLQLTQFDRHQRNLRKDKEAKTQIPAPSTELLRPHSVPTPDLGPPKIKEVKGSKAKGNSGVEAAVDNAPEKPAGSIEPFKDHIANIKEKYNDPKIEAQVVLFITARQRDSNHNAILYCLDEFVKYGDGVEPQKVKNYLDGILLRVNGNFNETEYAKESEGKKIGKTEAAGTLQSIGSIINSVVQKGE